MLLCRKIFLVLVVLYCFLMLSVSVDVLFNHKIQYNMKIIDRCYLLLLLFVL